jgi:predicted nucleic acid-binding protein
MDQLQRRAFFADALIAAVAQTNDAVLLTSDKTAARTFPVSTNVYR